MRKIVLFASGSGSNVENIIRYFENVRTVKIACVLTNRAGAQVLDRCKRLGVPALWFDRTAFFKTDVVLNVLVSLRPDLIVLAGFLWKMPPNIVKAFRGKIVNIHPALLPKYGGKGMYGMHVHRAVKANGEPETGMTVHYVDERYDNGQIIFQERVALSPGDTPESIAQKVRQLEHGHYPKIIEKLLDNGR